MTRNIRKLIHALCILVVTCSLRPLFAAGDAFEVYAYLTGKTVLRTTALPRLPEPLIAEPSTNETLLVAQIENALAERGIEAVQDGPHFIRLFTKATRNSLTNSILRGAQLAELTGREIIEPGLIDFRSADLNQVLDIYAVLSQRTLLRPAILPALTITLRTTSALNKDEVLYAFATVLALNGISLVEDGVRLAQVVPDYLRSEVHPSAPLPQPGARLFDPKQLPSLGASATHFPLTEKERVEQELERMRLAFYEFMRLPKPRDRSIARLFGLYASLAGKTAQPLKQFVGVAIWFHVSTPLSKSELIYAIETTFALNGYAVIPVDDRTIRLGRSSEVTRKSAHPSPAASGPAAETIK
jgi:hypothetical protein